MAFIGMGVKTLEELAGNQIRMVGGLATLTDAVTLEVVTGLSKVLFAFACPGTEPDSFNHSISVADNATAGTIDLAVKDAAPTGSRVVNWLAIGY